MEHVKKQPRKPKRQELVESERYVVPILTILNPVFAGLAFYYGWRNAFPRKAQAANYWSLGAFLGWLLLSVGLMQISGKPPF